MNSSVLSKSYKSYPLADLTTLKIGGNAELAFIPASVDELIEIRDFLFDSNQKLTVIGAGSNLLISSKGISGGVVFTKNINGFQVIDDSIIKVGCGMKSANLAKILHSYGLSGLEFLIGIPGTLGGAVTMNSSAHGQSIKDVIESVEVFDIETGKVSVFDKTMLDLSYRDSFVESHKHFILNATFKLAKDDPQKIHERMDFHVSYRMQNHPPLTEPSAGSTFRNPKEGVFIGQLLEQLGAKGWQEGGARISDKHANFIINHNNATSLDVSRLMYRMYNGIKENFGYDVIAEIRFVGEFSKEEEKIWKSFQVH